MLGKSQSEMQCSQCGSEYNDNDRKPISLICGDTLCEKCYDANLIEGGKKIKCPLEGEVAFAFKMFNEVLLAKLKPVQQPIVKKISIPINDMSLNKSVIIPQAQPSICNVVCSAHPTQKALIYSNSQKKFVCYVCQSNQGSTPTPEGKDTPQGSGTSFKTFLPDQLKNIALQMLGSIDEVLQMTTQAKETIYNMVNTSNQISSNKLTQDFHTIITVLSSMRSNQDLIKQIGIQVTDEQEETKTKEEIRKITQDYEQKIKDQQEQSDFMENLYINLKTEVEQLRPVKQENAKLQRENSELMGECQKLTIRITEVHSQMRNNPDETEKVKQAQEMSAYYQSECDRISGNLRICEQRNYDLTQEVTRLQSENIDLSNQITKLRDELNQKPTDKGREFEIRDLNDKVLKQQEQIKSLNTEMEQIKESYQRQLGQKDNEIIIVKREMVDKDLEVDHWKNKCKQGGSSYNEGTMSQMEKQTYEEKILSQEQTIDRLRAQLEEMDNELVQAHALVANREYELEMMREGVQDPYNTFQ